MVLDLLKPYQELTVSGAHSGFHLVLGVNNGLKEKELVNRALQAGLKVYPVSAYSIIKREETLPKIVLGFAGIPENELGTAIKLLLKSWKIF
jgi:GntR family transcriptional regulator/MocR family aminotransferase